MDPRDVLFDNRSDNRWDIDNDLTDLLLSRDDKGVTEMFTGLSLKVFSSPIVLLSLNNDVSLKNNGDEGGLYNIYIENREKERVCEYV